MRIILTFLALILIITVSGCDRSSHNLIVSDIIGPSNLTEGETKSYSVLAHGDSGISYLWAVEPSWVGKFSDIDSPATQFITSRIGADTEITIRVVVNSDNGGPEIRSMDVLLQLYQPEPEPPVASAYIWLPRLTPGSMVQFYNDSTDPDGNNDIVLNEWDFSFDPVQGFTVENVNQDPGKIYQSDGTYLIQLRVTDSSGLSDMLDEPLEVEVVSDVGWGLVFGGTGWDQPHGIDVDQYGNIYTAGHGSFEADYDPGPGYDPGDGGTGYVNKLNPDGSMEWVYTLGVTEASSHGPQPKTIAISPSGEVHVAGSFKGTADFDTGAGVDEKYTEAVGAFVQVVDSDGVYQESESVAGSYDYYNAGVYSTENRTSYSFESLDFDGFGNRYIVETYEYYYKKEGHGGYYETWYDHRSTLKEKTLDGQPGVWYTSSTSYGVPYGVSADGYVVYSPYDYWPRDTVEALAPDNTSIWTWNDPTGEISTINHIEMDKNRNTYFAAVTDKNPDLSDTFILMLDPDGFIVWNKPLGETVAVTDLAVSTDGSIYIVGNFDGLMDFDPGPDKFFEIPTGTCNDYLLKLAPNGDFQWVRTWGDWSSYYPIAHVVTDYMGDVIVTGRFSHTVDLKPGPDQELHTTPFGTGIYLIKFAPDGEW